MILTDRIDGNLCAHCKKYMLIFQKPGTHALEYHVVSYRSFKIVDVQHYRTYRKWCSASCRELDAYKDSNIDNSWL